MGKYSINTTSIVNITIIIAFAISIIGYVYGLEKRVTLLESHDSVVDQQIVEIKSDQTMSFSRLEDKIDRIYSVLIAMKDNGRSHT